MTTGEAPRRALLLGIATLGAMTLPACSPPEDAKPSAVATFANHDKIVQAMDELAGAVDKLDQAIGGFDDDNWRDVVPSVREAAGSVESALANLKDLMAGKAPDN
jgi:hypothetical protein